MKTPYLVVDLDGTLIYTDMLHESAAEYVKSHPMDLFRLPFWLQQGKAYLKHRLAEGMTFDPELLPYNIELLNFLRSEKAKGRTLVLCTATNQRLAEAITTHLGLFQEVLSSNKDHNLSGEEKARTLVARYGEHGFDYVGNSVDDIPVWKQAHKAIVVNASPALLEQAKSVCEVERVIPGPVQSWRTWLRTLRIHQWMKNVLLFAPVIAAHRIAELNMWGPLLLAFLSFGLCASSVYIINDVLDRESDRQHPRKRKRPIASGYVSIAQATVLAPILFCVSLVLATMVNGPFLLMLLGYFTLTLCYSLFLKRILLLDCILLAMLYTVRIISGGLAVSMPLSFWLLTFSVFLFLNLAFVKRYAELVVMSETQVSKAHGRAYMVTDLPLIQTFGIASGYTSVLVLALYLNSQAVHELYAQATFLWLTLPIMIFWVSWVWIQAHRGNMNDDPVLFATQDTASLLSGLAFAVVMLCASFL